jgi:hypothetical protein
MILAAVGACAPSVSSPEEKNAWQRHVVDDSSRGADGVRLADVNGDGRPDIATGWEEGAVTRVVIHPGPARAKDKWIGVTVGPTPSVEDALPIDLDGDGAVDVVTCCEGKTNTMFVHWAPVDNATYLQADAWKTEAVPASVGLMAWMFCSPMPEDGSKPRALVAGGKNAGAKVGLWLLPENPRNLRQWRFVPLRDCGWIMSLISADMNGDGDADILLSDRKGLATGVYWLENPGRLEGRWTEHLVGGGGREVMFVTLADLDGDGLVDVLAAAKPREVLWLRRLDRTGQRWETKPLAMPDWAGTAKAVAAGDIDGDGRSDIVFTCEDAKGKSGVGWLSQPQKTGLPWAAHDIAGRGGIKYDLMQLIDLDGDGDLDVLTCEERRFNAVIWYENPQR